MVTAGELLVPEIILAECANALWKAAHRRLLPAEAASEFLETLLRLPLTTIALPCLTPRAFDLALAFGHPVYDCYYLALAIERDCRLATADERLHRLAFRAGLDTRAVLVR